MIAAIVLLVLGAIASSIFIVSKVINYSLKTIILKTIASIFFVALAILCFCLTGKDYFIFKLFVILGLFFGLLGDVFLGFKYITTKTKKIWILLGMFAFALGHMFYTVALLTGFYLKGHAIYMVFPFLLPILIIFVYMLIAKKIGINFGKGMFLFACFYLYCLFTMFSSSLSMTWLYEFKNTTLIMFLCGAFCFAISDLMLTGNYFKPGKRSKAYRAAYSIFYYVAQFIIAFSIFFLA